MCVSVRRTTDKPNMNDKKRSATNPIQLEKSKESRNDAGYPSSSSWASAVSDGISGSATPSQEGGPYAGGASL